MKKAQGLSINAIIIAVIALVVLVVLVAIFTGRLGLFSRGVSEVSSCQQICEARGYLGGDPGTGDTIPPTYTENDALLGARDSEGRQCYCRKE